MNEHRAIRGAFAAIFLGLLAVEAPFAQMAIGDPDGLSRAVEVALAQQAGRPVVMLADGALRAQAHEASASMLCQPLTGEPVSILERGWTSKGLVAIRVEVSAGRCARKTGWVNAASIGVAGDVDR